MSIQYFSDIKDRPPRYRPVRKFLDENDDFYGPRRRTDLKPRSNYSSDDSLSTISVDGDSVRRRQVSGQSRNKPHVSGRGKENEKKQEEAAASPENVSDIYSELQMINEKMKVCKVCNGGNLPFKYFVSLERCFLRDVFRFSWLLVSFSPQKIFTFPFSRLCFVSSQTLRRILFNHFVKRIILLVHGFYKDKYCVKKLCSEDQW